MRGIFLTLSLVAAGSASAQSLTTVISSYKVRPEETPPLKTTAELHAARNEFEAFQLVVLGGGSGLTQVRATAPTLTLQGTPQSLPSSAVHLYRLATVHATFPSALDGAPGEWPDALIPDVEDGPAAALVSGAWREVDSIGETRAAFPFDVAPNRNGLIWVEVQVPINATAGDYTGSITVLGWSGVVPFKQSVSVLLRVRPFTLPSTSRFPSMFLMSVDQVCSAHGDGDVNHFCLSVPDERVWGRLYARFFLDHRISVGIPDSPDTSNWPGTFATFDNSYGALISGTDPFSRLPGAALTTVRYPWWQYGSTDPAVQLPRLQQWVAYTKSKGVFNRTLDYSGDEPGINGRTWSDALNRAGWVHSADPPFRVMFATYIDTYNANAGPLSNACNIITPLLDQLDGPPGTRIAGNQRDLTAGDRYGVFRGLNRLNQVWGYQSCNEHGCGSSTLPQAVNFPSFMTDASGVQNRAEPWLHFIYRLAGIHYYDTVAHLTTAWAPDGLWFHTGNGDGTLVYPGTPTPTGANPVGIGGTTHIPLASYRLKMLRDGMEDYEYLKLCAAKHPGRALAIARALFPMTAARTSGRETGSMYSVGHYPNLSWLADAQALESARELLAACIEV